MPERSEPMAGFRDVFIAAAIFATAPILIRFASGVGSGPIAFWRLFVGGSLVFMVALANRQLLRPTQWLQLVPVGLATAAHFLGFVAAVSWGAVATAVIVVYTAPALTAILAAMVLGEHLSRKGWIGVGVSISGMALAVWSGDALIAPAAVAAAAVSAMALAAYAVAGRRLTSRYAITGYAAAIYLLAALWLSPLAIIDPGRWSGTLDIAAVVALGAGPIALGHTLYNRSLRSLHPGIASLIAMLEVPGSILLAAVLFGEIPTTRTIMGMLVLLGGLTLTALSGAPAASGGSAGTPARA